MARRNQRNAGQMAVDGKKVKCFGWIGEYYNNPNHGYRQGAEPYVMFFKKSDEIMQQQKSYLKDGDVVIEFEEVARYKIANVSPRLDPIVPASEPKSAAAQSE